MNISDQKVFRNRRLISIVVATVLTLIIIAVTGSSVHIFSIVVTNRTATSATVTWLTNRPVEGKVVISQDKDLTGQSPSSFEDIYIDDRIPESTDLYGQQPKYRTHHVSVAGLAPGSTYYFKSVNGDKISDLDNLSFDTLDGFVDIDLPGWA